jgi:hypothetical protein
VTGVVASRGGEQSIAELTRRGQLPATTRVERFATTPGEPRRRGRDGWTSTAIRVRPTLWLAILLIDSEDTPLHCGRAHMSPPYNRSGMM